MSNHTRATLGEDPAAFMARVRGALGRQPGDPVPEAPAVDETLTRLASAGDDLPAIFAERAAAVGMVVQRVSAGEAVGAVLAFLREIGARRVGVAAGEAGRDLGLDAALREAGIEVVDWRQGDSLEPQYSLDAGITGVHAALAETGTLVTQSDADTGRGLSLVPPAHVAIVREGDLLPDLIDYYRRFEGKPDRELPSSIAFITGPSKTADIEGKLVTGVHGPGRVHIVLIA